MNLFGLDPNLQGRNISSILQKVLETNMPNKLLLLKKDGNVEMFSNNILNEQLSLKINDILKSPITIGDIVTLLKTLNVTSENKGNINGKDLYVSYENNILTISENQIIKEKKETVINTSKTLEYKSLENYTLGLIEDTRTLTKGDKVKDIINLLSQCVLFASDNGIGDVIIKQEEFAYFTKGEENIHDEKLEGIINKIQNNEKFTSKEIMFFFEQMITLSAEKEEDPDDRKIYKTTLADALKRSGMVDFAVKIEGRKLRVNFSYSNGKKLGAVMRVIESGTPPTMEALGLVGGKNGYAYRDVLSFPYGLILVVGPTGSGKSFSLTSMIGEINRTKYKRIITLEDPIEFEHENICSKIEQKEVGVDVDSYKTGLKGILRQKPHIIVLQEIRDAEVMEKALELSATGHVVFSTFHANDVIATIQRIMDFFPVEKQKSVLQQLGEFILGIFVQKLVTKETGGKCLIKEIMIKTENTTNCIMQNDMKTLLGFIEAGGKYGMVSNDQSIEMLYEDGLISQQTAVDFAKDKSRIKRITNYDEYADKN